MDFNFKTLSKLVDIQASDDHLSSTLSKIGLEVESLVDNDAIYRQFVVAMICEVQDHPNASKLKQCKVYDGTEYFDVICGAPNVTLNAKAVLAKIGSVIPKNGLVIKSTKIRGIESNGMLCSASELCIGNESDGIIVVPNHIKIGATIADAFDYNDKLMSISLTPNRGDCASFSGIAREIAAAKLGVLTKEFLDFFSNNKLSMNLPLDIGVKIQDSSICNEISFVKISNVDNRVQSPEIIQSTFHAIGKKKHTSLVDISNFAMHNHGRPNHFYDADKIEGDIIIRKSLEGEKFLALDGNEYILPENITVIADSKKILSIAGIIGGESSKVDEYTKNIIIEVAHFPSTLITKSSRILNIKTDSSYRFERCVDQTNTVQFLNYIINLVITYCKGCVEGGFSNIVNEYIPNHIKFNHNKLIKKLGYDIPKAKAEKILTTLGFEKKLDDTFSVPGWRSGLENEESLIEEILRIHSIENDISLKSSLTPKDFAILKESQEGTLRESMLNRGVNEIVSWSFIKEENDEIFNNNDLIKLKNPITQDLNVMRSSLLPGLLTTAQSNVLKGVKSISIFEIGKVYQHSRENKIQEKKFLSILKTGLAQRKSVFGPEQKVDFFNLRDDFYFMLYNLGITQNILIIKKEVPKYYIKEKSAALFYNKSLLGYVGELHPKIQKKFELKERVFCGELFIDNILEKIFSKKNLTKKHIKISKLQSIERDFCFTFNTKVEALKLIKCINALCIDILEDINIFDIYELTENNQIKYSITFSITLQPQNHSLREEEIMQISDRIISAIESNLNGKLRTKQ